MILFRRDGGALGQLSRRASEVIAATSKCALIVGTASVLGATQVGVK